MTDNDILKQMGLTDHELRDLLHKTKHYFDSLNPAQQALILHARRSPDEAAQSLHGDVTVEQLEHFLRKHGKVCPPALIWCRSGQGGDDDDDDEEAAEAV